MKINKNIYTKYFILVGISLVGLSILSNLKWSFLETIIGNKDPVLNVDGQIINFINTDENDKETLIIKSDQTHYSGTDGSDVYFSITNTSKKDESTILLFYFPGQFIPNRDDPPGTQPATVTSLEQRVGNVWQKREFFAKNIKINNEILGKAVTKRKPIPEDFEIKAGVQTEIPAGQTAYFKSRISFRPTDSGEFWIEALGKNGGYGLLDPTYSGVHFGSQTSTDSVVSWFASGSSNWSNRKKISIPKSKVSGGSDLSNFPVLFSVTDTNLRTTAFGGKAASGSGEFVFTSSNGTTVLPHEIETYSATTGEFTGWINVTTLSATNDTNLYIYYGGPAAGTKTNQRKSAVWNTNYQGVWHLRETVTDETTASGSYQDSTSNNNVGGQIGADDVVGKIGTGQNFDVSDYISVNPATGVDAATVTISAWIYHRAAATDRILSAGVGATNNYDILAFSNRVSFRVNWTTQDGVWESTVGSHTVNTWQYFAATYDRGSTANNASLYLNGILQTNKAANTNPQGSVETGSNKVRIGALVGTAGDWNGNLDEVRISNVIRSAAWIETEYNNQFKPSTFYALGGQETQTPITPGLKIKGGVKFR